MKLNYNTLLYLSICLFLSCTNTAHKISHKDDFTIKGISERLKSEPISCDTLRNEDIGATEFRITLPKYFNEEDLKNGEIVVLEYTWKLDNVLGGYTTVWYELKQDSSLRYLESLSYQEFEAF